MPGSEAARGCLILVVGPSGVGKDSVVAGLRHRLHHESSFRFPRRYITRPARGGNEGHHEVSRRRFEAMRADGAFLLSWQAHDTAYGIGLDAADALDRGINVITQLVARRGDNNDQFSLSCNPDITLDLLPELRRRRQAGQRSGQQAEEHPRRPVRRQQAREQVLILRGLAPS